MVRGQVSMAQIQLIQQHNKIIVTFNINENGRINGKTFV